MSRWNAEMIITQNTKCLCSACLVLVSFAHITLPEQSVANLVTVVMI